MDWTRRRRASWSLVAGALAGVAPHGACGPAPHPLSCRHVLSILDGKVGEGCGAGARVAMTSLEDTCRVDVSGQATAGLPRSGRLTGDGDGPLGRLEFVLFEGDWTCAPLRRSGNTIEIGCSGDGRSCSTTLEVTAEK